MNVLGLLAWLLVATSKVLPSNRFRWKLLSTASAMRRRAQPFRRNWFPSHHHPVGTLGEEPDGVPREQVALDPAVLDLLEEQPVGRRAAVVLEPVVGHGHAPAVHHRHAGVVRREHVAAVLAAVGVHEVEAVAQVAAAVVVDDRGPAGELEIDPVAVPANQVAPSR